MTHTRVCNTCHIEKPIEEYYRTEDKWHERRCKACTLRLDKERNTTLPPKDYGTTKRCKVCGRTLPIDCFPVLTKRYKLGKCFDCRNALASAQYHRTKRLDSVKESRKAAQKRFRQRNPEYAKEWMRTRRRIDPSYGKPTATVQDHNYSIRVRVDGTVPIVPDSTNREDDG